MRYSGILRLTLRPQAPAALKPYGQHLGGLQLRVAIVAAEAGAMEDEVAGEDTLHWVHGQEAGRALIGGATEARRVRR